MTQVNLSEAPAPLSPIPFNIPQAYKTTFDNGLRVVVFEDSRLPLVSYRLAFMTGDADDPAGLVGLTSAVSSMLTEGTENYSSLALAEKIERLGASLSASSSDDFTIISASALSLYNSDIIDLLAEVLFKPTFPENELDLYRRNMIENLKFQRSQPNFLANEQTARLIYGGHPYARVSPAAADVEKLTSNALSAFHRKQFVPNNAILIVVGDIEKESLIRDLQQRFGGWQRGLVERNSDEVPERREEAILTIVDRPGSAQANIVLANLAIKRDHPDHFAFLVMNQVLGAGASSRVFMNLREEKGYTYGAYTRIDAKSRAGDFEATAEVRTAVTGDSLREFFFELNRIRAEDVSDAELADAKNFLTGVFPIRAETQEGLTNLIASQELYGLPENYLQAYRDNVAAITAADVRRVANGHVHPDKLAIVIVGDAGDILPQAKEFASVVEVLDSEGNQLPLEKFEAGVGEVPVDFSGAWKLSLEFQGQRVPVSLTIDQDGNSISGTLETILGNGTITAGTVRGNEISATAATDIQGQSVDFQISALLANDEISGTISTAIIPEPLPFRGTRNG